MQRTLVAAVICVLIAPAAGLAQTPFAQKSIRTAVNRDRIALSRMFAAPVVQQQRPRERRWAGRHPVLFGALVGLGVGVAVEAAVIPGADGGEPHSVYLPMFGGVGAGIGALTGVIVSAVRR
jgi:hypothetical protein